ncbi:MAG: ribulose-phosphate 3-epimerase [Bacteroidetes bacterium]|nr:ribulose-phosphate 3-epimerase [Bacteroidota bacterium]MCL5033820.1 ribulose-phosphate 3-epimerase [Bacteroidota bacterium]
MAIVAPSLLSADFTQLHEQIRLIENGGAEWIHLDIMDGHFVPNLTFGPLLVSAVRKMTDLVLDAHLMIENPDSYIEQFVSAGADYITVHEEAVIHLNRTVNRIKQLGAKAGVAINPSTPVSVLSEIVHDADLVLIMSVNPGFGGQEFIASAYRKLSEVKALIPNGKKTIIEVDGGVGPENAAGLVRAGTDVLVAGTSIFKSRDITATVREMKAAR